MKVGTWNVNGIRARQAQVLEWLKTEQVDIACLQEIKASPSQIPPDLCDLEDYWCLWHGGAKGYSGVSLHVRKDRSQERPEFSHPAFDFENRIVTARVDSTLIASVYVPNGGKDFAAKISFLQAVEAYAETVLAAGDDLIICGDLNVARSEMDVHPRERREVIGQLPEERALFERILDAGLVDIARSLDPANEGLFTWWAPWRDMRARNIGWRLDYVLASARLGAMARSCTVSKDFGSSDHAPVIAIFE